MPQTATGNAILLGLGIGRSGQFGVPAGSLIRYNAVLPVGGPLIGEEAESGQINPSGYIKKGIPGPKGAEIEFGHPLTAAHFLEFFEHIFGKVVKANPAAGVYTYTFDPLLTGNIDTHFWGVFSSPPVEKFLEYGIKFGRMEMAIGDNNEIPVRMTGTVANGTLLGPPEAEGGNTGTYALGPWLRGLVADPDAGSIWVRIESHTPLTFKVIQKTTAPIAGDWTAATTVFTVVTSGGDGIYQNLQSSEDGLDLGVWDENKDPLEIIWPGDDTAHQDGDVGDVWQFKMPGAWSDPATSEITGARRFTSAHWITRFKEIGAGSYDEKGVTGGTIAFEWAIEAERGNLSRYPFDIIRPGQFTPTVELARSFTDRFFADKLDRHNRIDMQMAFEGRQLDATYREGIVCTYPAAAVTEGSRPAANAGKIEESVTLRGETNDGGDEPCTVVVTTDRDWTPST